MPATWTEISIRDRDAERMGFFTDTTVCIGCKACEVACKQWNDLPADGARAGKKGVSYDYTGGLSSSTWRHVHFVEPEPADGLPDLIDMAQEQGRWSFMSDVCKHCTNAG